MQAKAPPEVDDVLRVSGLVTEIPTRRGVVRAVDDVSLTVRRGEAVALVGESGCGKTMTALSLLRLLPRPGRVVSGEVVFEGRDLVPLRSRDLAAVRGRDIGMIFQDPMTFLNPIMPIGEQVAETLVLHYGTSKRAAIEAATEALRAVRIASPERVAHAYPHQLSGGMRQRVLIAMATIARPTLLIADEPTTALDVTIQAQVMNILADLREQLGSAMLLITHDLGLVSEYCDRVYVMYAGRIVEEATVREFFREPRHPYSAALLRSTLSIDKRPDRIHGISGHPPSLISPPRGCRFHARCELAFDRCHEKEPDLFDVGHRRVSRCWLCEEGAR